MKTFKRLLIGVMKLTSFVFLIFLLNIFSDKEFDGKIKKVYVSCQRCHIIMLLGSMD